MAMGPWHSDEAGFFNTQLPQSSITKIRTAAISLYANNPNKFKMHIRSNPSS
jgi:ornithine cyclodeaminase/alanine dehydrogenase-like protein (mu-crystallin family)